MARNRDGSPAPASVFFLELPAVKTGKPSLPPAVIQGSFTMESRAAGGRRAPGRLMLVVAGPAELVKRTGGRCPAVGGGGWVAVSGPARMLTGDEYRAMVVQARPELAWLFREPR